MNGNGHDGVGGRFHEQRSNYHAGTNCLVRKEDRGTAICRPPWQPEGENDSPIAIMLYVPPARYGEADLPRSMPGTNGGVG